jgi:hypothetical protein
MGFYSPFQATIPLYKVGCIRVTHPSAGRHHLIFLPGMLPLDLHVLSLPLAFILSQDQTLHCINIFFRYLNRIILIFDSSLFLSLTEVFFLFTPSLLFALSLSTYIPICFFTLLSLGFIFFSYLNDLISASSSLPLSSLSPLPSAFGVAKVLPFFFLTKYFTPFFVTFFTTFT